MDQPDLLFARGLDLVRRFRPTAAEPLLRAALSSIHAGVPAEVSASRVMITLAYVEAESGRLAQGLDLLDRARREAGEDSPIAGLASSQRGLLLLRAGRHHDARRAFDDALERLTGDPEQEATARLNRGLLLLTLGLTAEATADFDRCARLGDELGIADLAALARHNLGYLALLSGDLPRALREMDAAAAAMPHRDDGEHVILTDRARVLHACGMFADAEATLLRVCELLDPRAQAQDLAEAELLLAHVLIHLGRAPEARRLCARAVRRFRARGAGTWADLARLAQLRAAATTGARVGVGEVATLAQRLSRQGLAEEARLARGLMAALDAAQPLPAASARDGLLTRLFLHEVAAERARTAGDPAAALRRARRGLGELQHYQAGVGSLDLQAAVAGHGRRLAELGLAEALRGGRAATVFAWAEQARALASRLSPVTAPSDPDAAASLSALRLARRQLRSASLEGREDRSLRQRVADLERTVRERAWRRDGAARVLRPVTLAEVRAELGDDVLVAHVVCAGTCSALVVHARGAQVVPLGATRDVLEVSRRVRADLDALALRGIPQRLRDSVTTSLHRGLRELDERLLAGLPAAAHRGRLVLLPSDELLAVPWPLLPTLRGRPTSVARSATAWVHARRRPADLAGAAPPLLVCGPDLERAEEEILEVAGLWPGSTVLIGAQATGERTLGELAAHSLVHCAAHGVHESANPLFSALRLADGPLFGYDLARSPALPHDVVLSACDLGLATPSGQGEGLGMSAALLHQGVRSVVASVARVGDDVAREAMVAHHRRLSQGAPPAEALADALAHESLVAPFVCFGRGW
ncbi:MAG: CHAT domain-containing tetratricopeptide repeat protein [Kineosporiaceae bacterium]